MFFNRKKAQSESIDQILDEEFGSETAGFFGETTDQLTVSEFFEDIPELLGEQPAPQSPSRPKPGK